MFRLATVTLSKKRISVQKRGLVVGVLSAMMVLQGFLSVSTANDDCPITEYPVPTPFSSPVDITTGPDGNLWFTEENVGKIGRITTSGLITEFPLPAVGFPGAITSGLDGNIWFVTQSTNNIGRITTSGPVTLFPVPTFDSYPIAITSGPDGNLWFTEANAGKIGRITTSGMITEFVIPTPGSSPRGITTGPDGNIWFAEQVGNKIGRITPSGDLTEFSVPTPNSGPYGITTSPDGNIWFTEFFGPKIGRITPGGVITEFNVNSGNPIDITVGSDGNLWFVDFVSIRRITTSGTITKTCIIENANERFVSITAGPDDNIWVTNNFGNKIVRLELEQPPIEPSFDICIQDDSTGNIFRINSTTGDYQYTDCFNFTISGRGSVIKKGYIITLQHYSADRRVLARIDRSVRKATASIQLLSLRRAFTITDRNTSNSTCVCAAQ